MEKSLSKRIAERSSKKKLSSRAQNLAAFLALREDVKKAIDDGWPVMTIWEQLSHEKKIKGSYKSFRGLVLRLIKGAPSGTGKSRMRKSSTTATGSSGFKFNPNPEKKELF
ncbi:MAG: TraK family protein [Alphaproteobacteria bacterium]|nr:TraK family protein [Alphaproteobacteria bacterium]